MLLRWNGVYRRLSLLTGLYIATGAPMTNSGKAYIGIDIGGTNLRGALVSAEGVIVSRFRTESAISHGAAPFMERLELNIREMLAAASNVPLEVAAVGMGIPGLIDRVGTICSSVNMKPLEKLNLAQILSERIGLKVCCGNDANLIALAEAHAGAGQGLSSLVVVTIGTGLGSGLILDGKLWNGPGGFAAEFGHLTLEPDGRPCPCGNRGCLEQYVSASALSRYGTGRTPEELASAAQQGDQTALSAFERLGDCLGTGLASLLNLLNLEGIVIGGGVSASFDLMAPAIQRTLHKRAFPQIVAGVKLRKSLLGDDAGLLGGAMLAAEMG